MYVGSVSSIKGDTLPGSASCFLQFGSVEPSVHVWQTGRLGPSFALYEKKATHSPVGARVATTSCDQMGTTTASRLYRPVPVADDASTVCELVVQLCMPQCPASSVTSMYHLPVPRSYQPPPPHELVLPMIGSLMLR